MFTTILAGAISAFILSIPQPHEGDRIPDFSKVGYRWGDKEIPSVKVVKTLKAPSNGEDATELIQSAIDNMNKSGAILLEAGTYVVNGPINIRKSGIVLRGEGEKTVLVCAGQKQRTFVTIGDKFKRNLDRRRSAAITDSYVPFGSDFVTVNKPELFQPGDRVVVHRPSNEQWLSDIRMDRIDQMFDTYGIVVRQWEPGKMDFYYERIISRIDGNKLYLDNPIVMAMETRYGGGGVIHCSAERVSECGVENLMIVSEFDESIKANYWRNNEEYYADENHGWTAIQFLAAEHCWARNIVAKHFGYALAYCGTGSKNISVLDCSSCEPVSRLHGSRRYGYAIVSGECCLVKDCKADQDRHGFVLNGPTCGPNVYTCGSITNARADIGPHNRFATGGLYDCINTDGEAVVQDRGGSGHGHGWAGANMIFWNCEAKTFVVQGLWKSATNYAIGCIGEKDGGWYGQGSHERDRKAGKKPMGQIPDTYEERPDGVWVSQGKHVEPVSLYKYQLEHRKTAGIKAVPAQCYK